MKASELYNAFRELIDSDYLERRLNNVSGGGLQVLLLELTITVDFSGDVVAGSCVVSFEELCQLNTVAGTNSIRFYMDSATTLDSHELAGAIVDAYTHITAPVCLDWRRLKG